MVFWSVSAFWIVLGGVSSVLAGPCFAPRARCALLPLRRGRGAEEVAQRHGAVLRGQEPRRAVPGHGHELLELRGGGALAVPAA